MTASATPTTTSKASSTSSSSRRAARAVHRTAALVVALASALAPPARAAGEPRVRNEFRDGVLHVSVSDLPAGAAVGVTVTDTTHGHDEKPNGTPPGAADDGGAWPGREGGDIVGYPGTGDDGGGTVYRVCVVVNGESGPCVTVEKERTFFEEVLDVINVFKHVGTLFRWLFG